MDWLIESLHKNLIVENRYMYLLEGLGNTLLIALFATLVGVAIGMVIAVIRVYHGQGTARNPVLRGILSVLNVLCKVYLTVIRGTPVVVQLMIMYYVIFASTDQAVPVAILAFGINSGAYVSEIIRAGIMAVDRGQTEAGRSLGLSSNATMRLIILPQAIKNILPALGNEFIALLKETSVAGYITIVDLTRAGDIIRSRTWEAFVPLLIVAAVYLILVIGITSLLGMLERRLGKSDHR